MFSGSECDLKEKQIPFSSESMMYRGSVWIIMDSSSGQKSIYIKDDDSDEDNI